MLPARMLLLGMLTTAGLLCLGAIEKRANAQRVVVEGPVVVGPIAEQPFALVDPANTAATAAAAPSLNTIGARARRLLAQFDALTESPTDQTDEQQKDRSSPDETIDWDEALSLLEELIAEENHTVATAVEPGRFIALRELCHARIAALPAVGLQAYRDRVDPTARRLFEQGRDRNDPEKLRRVVNELFCSSWADDALLHLGDLALEQGDTLTATTCWRRITPFVSDPHGKPLAWSLRGVDLDAHGVAVAEIIRSATGPGLTCPGSDIPVGALLARFAMASLFDGDPAAAKTYARLLRLLDPQANGDLAGRSGLLAPIVDQMIEEANAWRPPHRKGIGLLVGHVWPKPIALSPPKAKPKRRPLIIVRGGQLQLAPEDSVAAAAPTVRPTVAAGVVAYRDGSAIRAVDLATGEPTLGPRGVLFSPAAATAFTRPNGPRNKPGLVIRRNTSNRLPTLPADEAMTLVGNRLLARVDSPTPNSPFGAPAIRSFDLSREGLESPVVPPVAEPWKIGGPPTIDATRVYLPIVDHQTTVQIAFAAFSVSTGRELWRTPIATAPAESAYGAVAAPRVGVTLAGETLFVNTNLGAIAALDKHSGTPRWVRLYDRLSTDAVAGGGVNRRGEKQGLLARGRWYVAPMDSDRVLALDAATGRQLWKTSTLEGDHHLLGISGDTLVVGGDQLRGLNTDTGRSRYTWPESRKAGLRGAGRGCLVAGEAFWPTRNRVLVFDAESGYQTRSSLDIADLGGAGANLVPAGERLIAAGVKGMTVFGPTDQQNQAKTPLLSLAPSP